MPETVGRYEILDKIGQGGMGAVYKAFDPVLRRTVAVKVISAVLDSKPDIRERFFREARAAGQLSHKNIIVIHDLGEDGGRPFLAMEYLTGAALSTRMTGGGRLSVRRAVDVMIQVCHALEYAHERGVVHRDITPANIFITDLDEVKILDFGLAHLVASELTRSETIMGTANYMSPEQVRGERVDRRTDIFATGVVLYELLSGRKAFEGDSFANTLFKVLEVSPPSLQELDPRLPPKLVAVVERALAKRREDRYQTAAELLQDLITCRDWTGSTPAVPATLAPTIVMARPAGASARVEPAVAATPTSAAWSPRRVRTTAIVGSVLAIAGALLIFDSWRDRSNDLPPRSDPAGTITQPTPTPQPSPPPDASALSKEPPAVATEPAKPRLTPPLDAPGASPADRRRADDAMARARKTRGVADAARADGLTAYRRAISTEGEAAGLYAAGQFGRAAARALEAEAMYRDAMIEARAAEAARVRASAESTPPPPVRAETPPVESPRAEPPRAEPPRAEPPRAEPPAAVRPEPAPEADPRDAIRTVVNQFVSALEARNIGALKTLWPSLPAAQERAIRSEFANARSLQVRLVDLRIEVDGATAAVTAMREYQILTADSHRLATTSRMTMRLRRTGEAWMIDGVTYQ